MNRDMMNMFNSQIVQVTFFMDAYLSPVWTNHVHYHIPIKWFKNLFTKAQFHLFQCMYAYFDVKLFYPPNLWDPLSQNLGYEAKASMF